MTPSEFFKVAEVGWRIRYGGPESKPVTIGLINRGSMYAYGNEELTDRRVILVLSVGQLKELEGRGRFDVVEVL